MYSTSAVASPDTLWQNASLHSVLHGWSSRLALLVLSVLLVGCGDSASTSLSEPGPDFGVVQLAQSDSVLFNRDTIRLSLERVHSNGDVKAHDGPAVWTSSHQTIARVNDGLVEAVRPGVVTIQARTDSRTISTQLRVLPTTEDLRLEVSDRIEVEVNDEGTITVEAGIRDVSGQPVADVSVDFRVLEEGPVVSAVTGPDGRASGILPMGGQAGEWELEVSSPGIEVAGSEEGISAQHNRGHLRRTVPVIIRSGSVATMELSHTLLRLQVGEEAGVDATRYDRFGNLTDSGEIEWRSPDASVASVNDRGVIKGQSHGVVAVEAVAMADGKVVATESVEVTVESSGGELPAQLEITSGRGQSAPAGEFLSDPLVVRVVNGSGDPMAGTTVRWSADSGDVLLAAGESVTGADGTASMTAQAWGKAGEHMVRAEVAQLPSRSFPVQVTPGAVETLRVTPDSIDIVQGNTARLDGAGLDAFGNQVPASRLSWRSEAPDVVSVGSEGRLTARAEGQATIVLSGDDVEASARVHVLSGEPTEPTGTPSRVTDLGLDAATETALMVSFTEVDDGAGGAADYQLRIRPDGEGHWGLARVVDAGDCSFPVRGTTEGATRRCTIEGLDSGSDWLVQLVAFRERAGTDPAYSELSNGLAASTEAHSGGSGSPESLEIVAPSDRFTSLEEEIQLEIRARGTEGAIVDAPDVTWSSSNPEVVSVQSNGRAVARAAGVAIISASAVCCSDPQFEMRVEQEAAALSVAPTSLTLQEGEVRDLGAQVLDGRGFPIEGVDVTWSSRNSSIVSVGSGGRVNALSAGSTIVDAASGSLSASAEVSVRSSSPGGGGTDGVDPFANAPTGWQTAIESDFRYSGITMHADRWFSIDGSNWQGREDVELGSDPEADLYFARKHLPEGLRDGHGWGRIHQSRSVDHSTSGIYMGYWFRLSPNWEQRVSDLGNKHVEVIADGPGVSSPSRIGWIGWNRLGGNQYRVVKNMDLPGASDRRVHPLAGTEDLGTFTAGDWVHVEILYDFNADAGRASDTGRIRMWVDGNLVIDAGGWDIRLNRLTNLWAPMTFGGGIGDVPHDQWVDLSTIRVMVAPN